MNLTKEAVEQMEAEEVEKNLKLLARTYKLDKPFKDWMTPELWDNLDNIVNTLAYLEDRKTWLAQYAHNRTETRI